MSNFLNTPISELWNKSLAVFKKNNEPLERISSNSSMRKGQLAVDVFQTEDDIIVLAPIAGVKIEDIEIVMNEDLLLIRGVRSSDVDIPQKNYYAQECFWGEFSRSIVLPSAVNTSKIEATFKNGILKVMIPKANKVRMKVIKIKKTS